MVRGWKAVLAVAGLAVLGAIPSVTLAQDKMQGDSMKKDSAMQDSMQHEDMGPDKNAKPLLTGTFHGKVHSTSGRATVYQGADGKKILRLTHFKTSNGPDVHVILVAAKDAKDDANFISGNVERIELGKLKGNEGDQNYELPENIDLAKFQTVSIYCERFNANFGAAPLAKF
ncbi:MAG TPA: DM13 domain-containing protein [Candidatus Sulfotelmatobacter sp.]|jgi:pentapeptide MXKDX repeat protein|nr:DM13 domain-containing protein [Candidatus Sulfotelmatobacter sp.]